jgi:hypothetical protein
VWLTKGDDANYVLITGGSGFIGSYLAQSLLEDEKCDRVILFDRDPDLRRITGFGIDPRRFTFVQGDLSIQNHVLEVLIAILLEPYTTSALSSRQAPRPTQLWESWSTSSERGTSSRLLASTLRPSACRRR